MQLRYIESEHITMTKKGFTLIELLVVIGIIGMIVAVSIPNFISARQRAGDAKKKEEMRQLANALNIYNNEFGTYPADAPSGLKDDIYGCGSDGTGQCPCVTGSSTIDFASGTSCENVYMKSFPEGFGPSATNKTIFYIRSSDGSKFCLTGTMNNKSDPDITPSQARCSIACGTNCNAATGRYCACSD